MIKKSLFFFISFVLAGSHFPSSSSTILATFKEKIAAGDINALQSIIETNSNLIRSLNAKPYRNEGLILAINEGHASVVEFLLRNGNVDAAAKNNEAIRIASRNGDVDIVRMLLNHPDVNPGDLHNEALIAASKNGHTDIVRLLLGNPKVDPSIGGGNAVFVASEMNHGDVVKLFINDGRADSTIYAIHILERASEFGNVDLVRFLLSHSYFSQLAHLVLFNGNLLSIKTLIEAGYKIEKYVLDTTLQYAQARGNDDIVKYLKSLQVTPKLPETPLIPMTEQCSHCLGNNEKIATTPCIDLFAINIGIIAFEH